MSHTAGSALGKVRLLIKPVKLWKIYDHLWVLLKITWPHYSSNIIRIVILGK